MNRIVVAGVADPGIEYGKPKAPGGSDPGYNLILPCIQCVPWANSFVSRLRFRVFGVFV